MNTIFRLYKGIRSAAAAIAGYVVIVLGIILTLEVWFGGVGFHKSSPRILTLATVGALISGFAGGPAAAWLGRWRHLLHAATLMCVLVSPARAQENDASGVDPARGGGGWSVVRLDVDVTLKPDRGIFRTKGVVTLDLIGLEESYGPVLLISTRRTQTGEHGIAFRNVESPTATIEIREESLAGRWQQALVQFDEPKLRGSKIDVHFECETQGTVRRMIVHESAAMADWLNAWLPFTLPDPSRPIAFSPNLFRAPGRTTLRLPVGWRGLVDGELVERRAAPDGTVEVWHTPDGIARGFVAGPYEIITKTVNNREIRVYLLEAAKTQDAERLAERLGQAIAAQESRLGPLPIPGSYSIVDFPRLPEQAFGAVSEQTHIIVQPPNLDYAHGNIQLFAHEVSHAWWGNLIGTTGLGVKWCSESLAQLGALIAIEHLDGNDALHEFLEFGRTGTDPYYSAAGYFAIVRQGNDLPIATMGGGTGTHALSNSKGLWILHMLRSKLGEETFYGVLREVIQDFAGRDLAADDLRVRFARAAPDHDLDRFFSQWLDRTGAPIFDVDWHANIEGLGLLLELTQIQEGEPFFLELEVEIELIDGRTELSQVVIDSESDIFEIETTARPVKVRLDPERKLLIWRPEYGPRPVGEIIGESSHVADQLRRAVVGSYRFEGIEKNVDVFERGRLLYMEPAGSSPVRLLHDHGGTFRVDAPGGMMAEFDLSQTPVQSFVSIEGGGRERYVARRIAAE